VKFKRNRSRDTGRAGKKCGKRKQPSQNTNKIPGERIVLMMSDILEAFCFRGARYVLTSIFRFLNNESENDLSFETSSRVAPFELTDIFN
jgi:hypothetical protein